MAATKADIDEWLDLLYADQHLSHMLVVCDTFDWEDFPVYVQRSEDVHRREASYNTLGNGGLNTVMEVYSRNYTKEEQLAEQRAFHYD